MAKRIPQALALILVVLNGLILAGHHGEQRELERTKTRLLMEVFKQLMEINTVGDTQQSTCNSLSHLLSNSQQELINLYHATCFSPCKTTWIEAIKKRFFLRLARPHCQSSTTAFVTIYSHKQRTYEAITAALSVLTTYP